MTYTWFPQPYELAKWIRERRDSYARNRYRDAQVARMRAREQLYPEFDKMPEADRIAAGFYYGHDVTERPPEVSPVTWQAGQQMYASLHGPKREPGDAERARGYDLYGQATSREDTTMTATGEHAEVAEFQHTYAMREHTAIGATLFRVINVPVHGIVYVLHAQDGEMTAETFGGKPLAEVPAEARAAVEQYEADNSPF